MKNRFQHFKWIICTKIIAEPFFLFDSTNFDITKFSYEFSIFRALFSSNDSKTGYNKIMEELRTRKGEQNENKLGL